MRRLGRAGRSAGRFAVILALAGAGTVISPPPGTAAGAASGGQGDGSSGWPTISADGRFVTFSSAATNLVPGDNDGQPNVFILDLHRHRHPLIRVPSLGRSGWAIPWAISADGRTVLFDDVGTADPAHAGLHVWQADCPPQRIVGPTAEPVRGGPYGGGLSDDGRYVAYTALAGTLNGGPEFQPFLFDRRRGTTELLAVNDAGQRADRNSGGLGINGNARLAVFGSEADNLTTVPRQTYQNTYVRDRRQRTTRLVNVNRSGIGGNGISAAGRLSSDGRYVAFVSTASDLVPGDTNGVPDLFVRDLRAGTTRRAGLSDDGRQLDEQPLDFSISATGRYVVFSAGGAVPGPTGTPILIVHVYLRDLATGRTELIDRNDAGAPADEDTSTSVPSISADGRYVAYASLADNLVPGDTNQAVDVFLHDRRQRTTRRISIPG